MKRNKLLLILSLAFLSNSALIASEPYPQGSLPGDRGTSSYQKQTAGYAQNLGGAFADAASNYAAPSGIDQSGPITSPQNFSPAMTSGSNYFGRPGTIDQTGPLTPERFQSQGNFGQIGQQSPTYPGGPNNYPALDTESFGELKNSSMPSFVYNMIQDQALSQMFSYAVAAISGLPSLVKDNLNPTKAYFLLIKALEAIPSEKSQIFKNYVMNLSPKNKVILGGMVMAATGIAGAGGLYYTPTAVRKAFGGAKYLGNSAVSGTKWAAGKVGSGANWTGRQAARPFKSAYNYLRGTKTPETDVAEMAQREATPPAGDSRWFGRTRDAVSSAAYAPIRGTKWAAGKVGSGASWTGGQAARPFRAVGNYFSPKPPMRRPSRITDEAHNELMERSKRTLGS